MRHIRSRHIHLPHICPHHSAQRVRTIPGSASQATSRFCLLALFAAASIGLVSSELAAEDKISQTPSPAGAKVYIISPKNGETLTSPVTVLFGLEGMGVAPAGIQKPNTGHHHLLLDGAPPTLGTPIPSDDTHIHFGGGQTQTTIELTPGKHMLQLLLADHLHIPHSPPVLSEPVEITVEKAR